MSKILLEIEFITLLFIIRNILYNQLLVWKNNNINIDNNNNWYWY